MIDLENKKERDKLIDDYFNKGKECDIKEVYQAIVNSTGDLEYEVDKLKSIIKQVKSSAYSKIDLYKKYLKELSDERNFLPSTRYKERIELMYRIKEQEELLEILNEEEK